MQLILRFLKPHWKTCQLTIVLMIVDVAGALMDSEGYLPYEATGDGVHLEPPYCVKWTDYLRTHTAQ